MEKKLASWKSGTLPIGGRAIILKVSLFSLPLHYMSLFPIPKEVVDKITRLQRQFFRNGKPKKYSIPLLACNVLELPKSHGGLNFENLQDKNTPLLFKWLWRNFLVTQGD